MPGRKPKGGIYAPKMAKKVGRVKAIKPLSRLPGALTFFTPEQRKAFQQQPK